MQNRPTRTLSWLGGELDEAALLQAMAYETAHRGKAIVTASRDDRYESGVASQVSAAVFTAVADTGLTSSAAGDQLIRQPRRLLKRVGVNTEASSARKDYPLRKETHRGCRRHTAFKPGKIPSRLNPNQVTLCVPLRPHQPQKLRLSLLHRGTRRRDRIRVRPIHGRRCNNGY